MKYRFSIGHSLTLGRFRIKLPDLGVWSVCSFPSFNPYRFRDTRRETSRSLMAIGTFELLSLGACCHSDRDVTAGAKKNSRSLYPSTPLFTAVALYPPWKSVNETGQFGVVSLPIVPDSEYFNWKSFWLFRRALWDGISFFFLPLTVAKIGDLCSMDSTHCQWAHASIRSHRR